VNTSTRKKEIGIVISKKRNELGLTQQEVADATGFSRNYISDMENGRYAPSLDALSKLAVVLNIDLNFLRTMTEIQA
jgi:transcriptional regulator with XRE-family HTH domain